MATPIDSPVDRTKSDAFLLTIIPVAGPVGTIWWQRNTAPYIRQPSRIHGNAARGHSHVPRIQKAVRSSGNVLNFKQRVGQEQTLLHADENFALALPRQTSTTPRTTLAPRFDVDIAQGGSTLHGLGCTRSPVFELHCMQKKNAQWAAHLGKREVGIVLLGSAPISCFI